MSGDGIIHALDFADELHAQVAIHGIPQIVRELVDNAIDAGATKITVELNNNGLDAIKVSDNGTGIDTDGLLLLGHRASSKIQNFDDVAGAAANTRGFRGEALHSIQKIAEEVSVTTSTGSCSGVTRVLGTSVLTPTARDRGTTITVTRPLLRVPVRERQASRDARENVQQVVTMLQRTALGRPSVDLHLYVITGRTRSPRLNVRAYTGPDKSLGLIRRWASCFGDDEGMVAFDFDLPHGCGGDRAQITGVISRTQSKAVRPAHDRQFVFAENGRPLQVPALTTAVRRVFARYSSQGRPAFALFLACNPQLIDITADVDKQVALVHDIDGLAAAFSTALAELLAPQEVRSQHAPTPQSQSNLMKFLRPGVQPTQLPAFSNFSQSSQLAAPSQESLIPPPSLTQLSAEPTQHEADYTFLTAPEPTPADVVALPSPPSPPPTAAPVTISPPMVTDWLQSFRAGAQPLAATQPVQVKAESRPKPKTEAEPELELELNLELEPVVPVVVQVEEDSESSESVEPSESLLDDEHESEEVEEVMDDSFLVDDEDVSEPESASPVPVQIPPNIDDEDAPEQPVLMYEQATDREASTVSLSALCSDSSYSENSLEQPALAVVESSQFETQPQPRRERPVAQQLPLTQFLAPSATPLSPTQPPLPTVPRPARRLEHYLNLDQDLPLSFGAMLSVPTQCPPLAPAFLSSPEVPSKLWSLRAGARLVGQFNSAYLMVMSSDGLLIAIDQHAADEACTFERIVQSLDTHVERQPALIPTALDLSPAGLLALAQHIEQYGRHNIFRKLGLDISVSTTEDGAPLSATIASSSIVYGMTLSAGDVIDMAERLAQVANGAASFCGVPISALAEPGAYVPAAVGWGVEPERLRSRLASKACRTSIMAGTYLSQADQTKLLQKLDDTTYPYFCPHGRPTARLLCKK